MQTYLLAEAGRFRLLIPAKQIATDPPVSGACRDLSFELGGEAATTWIGDIGVTLVHGLIELAEDDFAPLPGLLGETLRHVDAITRDKLAGSHAFRLRRPEP